MAAKTLCAELRKRCEEAPYAYGPETAQKGTVSHTCRVLRRFALPTGHTHVLPCAGEIACLAA